MVTDSDRSNVKVTPRPLRSLYDRLLESKMWGEIRCMAETDEGMKELISQVKTYYYLRKEK